MAKRSPLINPFKTKLGNSESASKVVGYTK